MLVQAGELSAYAVDAHSLLCAVCALYETPVRQVAVCIGIARTPVYLVFCKCVATGKLGVVCCSGGVVILHIVYIVRLSIKAHTLCVTVLGDLIKDIFPLVIVAVILGTQGEVEHCAQAHIVAVLVICSLSKGHRLVVGGVVWSVERVLHI